MNAPVLVAEATGAIRTTGDYVMDDSTATNVKLTHNEREAILAAVKAGEIINSVITSPAILRAVDEAAAAINYAQIVSKELADADAAIVAMGGDPKSSAWDDWDIHELIHLGEMARHVREAYGARLTIELPQTQRKRGPKPLTQDELMEIAWELETAKERDGIPNYIYIQRNPHITKHSATKAIQFVADNPSIYGKFREKKMLE